MPQVTMLVYIQSDRFELTKKITVLSFIVFTVCIQACKQHGGHRVHSATEQKYKPGLHLQAGVKFYCNIDNETTTTFKVSGNDVENANLLKAGLIYEVLKDTIGGFLVKMTYDRFNVVLKTKDNESEMNSDNGVNSIDPVERMLGMLKGSYLLVTINSKGQVTGVNGYKELTDKIMSGVTTQNEVNKAKMRTQLLDMLGEGFVKNNMEQGFSLLPDTAVYVGDSWTKSLSQLTDIKLNIQGTYTLESMDDNIAEIDAAADVNDTDSSVNLMGYDVAVNLEGKEEGTYKADMNTGMMISGKSELSIKGTMEVQNKEVPMRIKVKKEISLKKIQ